jgi:uncharacterized protein (TIGR00251 family)
MTPRPGPGWLTRHPDGVRLALKVTPRAAETGVQGVEVDGAGRGHLAVRVSAPPESGKANAAVIKLLAKRWRVPRSELEVVSGAGARRKVVLIHGPPEALIARLEAIEGGGDDALAGRGSSMARRPPPRCARKSPIR